MKVGDKVRIIKLVDVDKKCTDLKVGDTGVIVDIDDVVSVKIDRHFKINNPYNYNECDGSYDFLISQLEVITEVNMIQVNTTDLTVTVRLQADTNFDFFIDTLLDNGYWVCQKVIDDNYVDVTFKERK